jgi:uncharacterized protein
MGDGPFTDGARYNAYGRFLRQKFGCRVYKISVDAGFTCPNRDGSVGIGGCTYCNNASFRPRSAERKMSVGDQISQGIEYLANRFGARRFIVYFQSYTNTYAALDQLIPLYESALALPEVVGLAIGTRPDCVDDEKLAWLEKRAKDSMITLEYGLESIHNSTLTLINRGHDVDCWFDAVRRSSGRGISLCAHLILGLPGETREDMLAAAPALSDTGLDSLKIHHLHVVRNTAMAGEYERDPFPLLGCEEYLELAVDFLERLNPAIKIQRLFGLAPAEQVIGPIWGKTKAELQHAIELKLQARQTYQGRLYRR